MGNATEAADAIASQQIGHSDGAKAERALAEEMPSREIAKRFVHRLLPGDGLIEIEQDAAYGCP